ncbi:hypothetical protein AB0E04_17280 [Streptomyces sp. NPDC048251]|uniref:hypothetical protein n=1 Tax=Streptomyces sp. NPDC048251 TaxID=3154501 RepID=UPI00343A5D6A
MTAFVLTVDYMEADYDGILVVCASDYGETTVATTGSKAAAYQAFNRYYQNICGEQNCFDDRKATETDRRRPLHHHARPVPTLADHRDYRPGWNETIDDPKARSNTYEDYKRRTTIYQERKAELDAFYDRFDLEEIDGGERWRCKTCGAHGETWKPMPGLYDYPHAIGTVAHRHPTCERTSA